MLADDLDHAQFAVIATIRLGFRVRVVRWSGHRLIDLYALLEYLWLGWMLSWLG